VVGSRPQDPRFLDGATESERRQGDDPTMKKISFGFGARGAAAAVVCAWSATASAQTIETPPAALNRFEPSETWSDWFANESLDLRGNFRPAL
jgi:hypothetical protein